MTCPICGRRVSERDAAWARGVAGHFECLRRQQASNTAVALAGLVAGLLMIGGFIGLMAWFFSEVDRK